MIFHLVYIICSSLVYLVALFICKRYKAKFILLITLFMLFIAGAIQAGIWKYGTIYLHYSKIILKDEYIILYTSIIFTFAYIYVFWKIVDKLSKKNTLY